MGWTEVEMESAGAVEGCCANLGGGGQWEGSQGSRSSEGATRRLFSFASNHDPSFHHGFECE